MAEVITLKVSTGDTIPKLVSYPIAVAPEGAKISTSCKGKGKKRKYILSSNCHGLPFEAQDYSSQNLCKYALGFYDENKKELELLPANHIFIMEKLQDTSGVDVNDILSPLSHQQRKANLTEAFGSKKKKRAMKAIESNTISADSISTASALSQIIVSTNESTHPSQDSESSHKAQENAAKDALEAQRGIMLPPHDTSALTLQDAYPLQDLLTKAIHQSLKEWVVNIAKEYNDKGILAGQGSHWNERLGSELGGCIGVSVGHIFSRFETSPSQLTQKLGLLLLYHVQLKFCKVMLDSRRAIEREELQTALAYPPSEVFRHLTHSFSVFRKVAGKPAFASTKVLMYVGSGVCLFVVVGDITGGCTYLL